MGGKVWGVSWGGGKVWGVRWGGSKVWGVRWGGSKVWGVRWGGGKVHVCIKTYICTCTCMHENTPIIEHHKAI